MESKDSISLGEKLAVPTERTGIFYSVLLGLDRSFLGGKKICNIGAGGTDLKREWEGCGATIVNVDLRYKRGNAGVTDSHLIAGDMTKQPFADNSFDIAVDLWAAGYTPKSKDTQTLRDMIRVSKEKVILYPCRCSEKTRQFIKDNGLEMIVQLETPKIDLKMLTEFSKKDRGLLGKVGRLYGNLNYTVMELLAKLWKGKRLTIDTHYLKKNYDQQKVVEGLIASGLDLRAG